MRSGGANARALPGARGETWWAVGGRCRHGEHAVSAHSELFLGSFARVAVLEETAATRPASSLQVRQGPCAPANSFVSRTSISAGVYGRRGSSPVALSR